VSEASGENPRGGSKPLVETISGIAKLLILSRNQFTTEQGCEQNFKSEITHFRFHIPGVARLPLLKTSFSTRHHLLCVAFDLLAIEQWLHHLPLSSPLLVLD